MRTFSPGAFADVMISRPHLSSATTMDEIVKPFITFGPPLRSGPWSRAWAAIRNWFVRWIF
jgi:hypothetical protein